MTQITVQPWGEAAPGQPVQLFTLTNEKGTRVDITDFGGRIVSLSVPDREGKFADIVLGCDHIEGYVAKNPYLGALVGRYANRIRDARFELDGVTYELAANNGKNSLHGGVHGFDKVLWDAQLVDAVDGRALQLRYTSIEGEEGYPGRLTTIVTYTLTEGDGLEIDYKSTANRPTVLNLTNHSYFDLSGDQAGNILQHELILNASHFTPITADSIPTGEIRSIEGTPFDFRRRIAIGARIDAEDEQIRNGIGYDHNFVIDRVDRGLSLAARVFEPKSGRVMEVLTTQPGIQFYSGNHLDGSVTGKGGVTYGFRHAFCLETQHFPDSPNQPQFPSTRLNPDEQFHQKTIYRFSTES